ncbi:MAG: cobalt ECF transporter T component CbiQ [Lentisphaerae bacterium RIFOXYB12_FULL_65_16]|nr:MAG: cobalt ECF transporter T component CbiQ [Lentisphaerae bacterium RIFOXYA12_64_32]OGV92459.1 MAG: cobalt ECF transporter T component CbiQ [Lentisphaerae bacterium RIFOXYB12_FULL_65_16]
MHELLLSPYQHRQSRIHRLPAGMKLAGAGVFVMTVVLLPRTVWSAYGVAAAILLLVAALSRLPPGRLVQRLLLVEPFALGVALLALLQPNGLEIFLAMLTKSTLCLFCMVLLAAVTRFSDVLQVLWRIGVPSLLVTTLALMYRYLFLLFDEAGCMARARRSRTFRADRWSVWRSSATVIAQLFVRTSERAERVYAAMCARGWKT